MQAISFKHANAKHVSDKPFTKLTNRDTTVGSAMRFEQQKSSQVPVGLTQEGFRAIMYNNGTVLCVVELKEG